MTLGGRVAIGVWIAILIAAGWILSRAVITADLTAFLPSSVNRTQALLVGQLRDGVASRMVLIAIEGAPHATLAATSKTMAERLTVDARFSFVANGAADRFEADRALIERYRYLLSPAVNAERFTPTALRESLETGLAWLASPVSAMLARALPIDPTGETLQVLAQLAGAKQPEIVEGVWFSADGKRALVIAETRAAGFDTDAQSEAQAAIRALFVATQPPASARLLLAGPSVFAVSARESIEGDAWRLSLVATVLVLIILAWAYRSFPLMLAGALPVLTGLAVGVAAVALGFGAVHGITLGFGATLIGEAIDYPTYLVLHRRENELFVTTLDRWWPTLRLAVLTTVFSGVTMLLSSFPGLAQLGVLLVVGILAAGAVTRWVLPALALERFANSKRERLPSWCEPRRLRSAPRAVRWIVMGLIVAAAVFIATQGRALWDDDLESLSPITNEQKNLDGELRTELGAPDVRYLVAVLASSREAALQASEALQAPLAALTQRGAISGFDMAARFLPSEAMQAKRRAALPPADRLAAALSEALQDLPFKPNRFGPFLADVERTRSGLTLAVKDLESTGLGLRVRGLLTESAGEWTALVPLAAVTDAAALHAGLAPHLGPTTLLLDLKAESNAMVASYRGESIRLTALGLAAMLVVLALGLRSVRGVLRVFVPVAAAIVLDVALLASLGVRLSLFHLIALLLVVGVGLNYALFFAQPTADAAPADTARTTLSVVVCALTTLAAFGALATSSMPVLRALGLTVAIGIVVSFFLAALFAPRRAV